MYAAYVGLGSNLGDRRQLLQEAIDRIGAFAVVTDVANVYETAPVGFVSEHAFLNTAIALDTADDPGGLLKRLKRTERAMGRRANTHRTDRQIDLDILMYAGLYYVSGRVVVPHPALEERRFALAPLNDIAGRLVHPISGTTVKTLLAQCTDRSAVVAAPFTLHLPS
jgi:2-amino-4-hydroxy-6-hydroxymethyldihydropteridine diphosphokinase